ncbi:MAG: hypothetical protein ACRCZ0_08855 [Cetobacterium sp.]
MAKNIDTIEVVKKITVQSVVNGVLRHNGVELAPFEIVSLEKELAESMIETGYVKAVKTREV